MWNYFKHKPRLVLFEKIDSLGVKGGQKVYFYLERQKELFVTTFQDIIEFVEEFEPWDEMDAYIFTEKMDWIIAITHEDNKLLCVNI